MKIDEKTLKKRLEELKEYRTEIWLLQKKEGDSVHLDREYWETEGKIKMVKELLELLEIKGHDEK